jgi:hypothetical protein
MRSCEPNQEPSTVPGEAQYFTYYALRFRRLLAASFDPAKAQDLSPIHSSEINAIRRRWNRAKGASRS